MQSENNHLKQCAQKYLNDFRKHQLNSEEFLTLLNNPMEGLEFVKYLVLLADNESELAFIAAGPFEDLMNKHAFTLEEPLTLLVRKEKKMRLAIQYIWTSQGSKAHQVLHQILKKFS